MRYRCPDITTNTIDNEEQTQVLVGIRRHPLRRIAASIGRALATPSLPRATDHSLSNCWIG